MKLNNIIIKANENIDGIDWNIVMAYAETAKSSAQFWYPASLGGNGTGYALIIEEGKFSRKKREIPGWVKADGRGAGYSMVSWALTGGAGGPVGFLASSVLGGAFSSFDYHANK